MEKSRRKLTVISLALLGATVLWVTAAGAQQQVLSIDPATQNASPNATVSVNVNYATDPANSLSAGSAFFLHFDSSQLTFVDLTNVFPTNILAAGQLEADTNDADNDPATDMRIRSAWLDLTGNWPPGGTATLYTANFTAAAGFTGTTLNLAAVTVPPGFTFASSSGTISLLVPQAVPDTATTDEDTSVNIAVLDNDVGEGLRITDASSPSAQGGTVTFTNRMVTYTPAENFNGMDTFTYTVNAGDPATATVTVTVNPVNDAPTAVDDTATTVEDTAVTINVRSNDEDIDGDTLTVTEVGSAANGTASVNTAGTAVRYNPNANFFGTDTFTYTISDGNEGTATANVTVTVTPVPDIPVAENDTATALPGVATTINVLGNDRDDDPDTALTIIDVSQPANGTVVNNGTDITYTSNADFTGEDTFTYTISDATEGGTATATVTITVAGDNQPPDAVDDTASATVRIPQVINVLANDSDPDEGDVIRVIEVTQPTNGEVVISNDGADVTFTAGVGAAEQETFTYTISDNGDLTDTATVTVTINQAVPFVTPQDNDVIAGMVATEVEVPNDTVRVDYAVRQGGGDFTTFSSSTTPPFFTGVFDTADVSGPVDLQAMLIQVTDAITVTTPSEIISVTVDNANPEDADIHETPNVKFQNLLQGVDNTVVLANGVRLNIPAGSLANDDRVVVALVSVEPFDTPQGTTGVVFGPDADQMRVADISLVSGQATFTYTVTIPYVVGEGIDETDLGLFAFNETTSLWEPVANAMQNTTNNFFTADVTTPAVFGVFARADITEPPSLVVTFVDPAEDIIRAQIPEDNVTVMSFNVRNDGQEAATINQIDLNFNEITGDASLITLTVGVLNASAESRVVGRTTVDGIPASLSVPITQPLVVPAGGAVTVDIELIRVRGTRTETTAAVPASSRFAWLLLTPVLALVLLPRWRRGGSKFTIGLLLVALVCTVALTACPDDDGGRRASARVVIPAGGIQAQGAVSGLPVAVPDTALQGPQLVLEK